MAGCSGRRAPGIATATRCLSRASSPA
jgi:hypothetical protein